MKEFIIYLLQVSVCLGIFSSIYFLFLRKQTFFRFNRIFLLIGLIGAFILPFIQFTYDVAVMPISIPITEELPDMIPTTNSISLSIWHFIFAIYMTGVTFLITRNIKSYAKLYKIKKEGKCKKIEGYNVVESPETGIAFSVLNYIFINPEKLQAKEKEVILKHEISHIKQKHWVDLLCGECALLLQWFNPLIWFYIHWIKENHEYLADQAVIEAGESSAVYRAVLINQQFQDPIFSFANSFSYPNHLNRLNMMKKTKTQSWKKISVLAILPLFGVFFSLSAKPNYVEVEMNNDGSLYPLYLAVTKSSTEKQGSKIVTKGTARFAISDTMEHKPLVFIDGEEKRIKELNNIDPNTIESINVLKENSATEVYGEKGKNGVVLIELKKDKAAEEVKILGYKTKESEKEGSSLTTMVEQFLEKEYTPNHADLSISNKNGKVEVKSNNTDFKNVLTIVDGKEVENISDIDPNTIESVSVLKEKSATEVYGDKGKNGVVLITLKGGTKVQNKGSKNTKLTAIGDKTVRGTVVSSVGKPLVGVAIKVKGTTSGTVTDKDGNYSIKLNDGDILSFSYVDYKAKEVIINKESSTVNVTLEQ